MLQISDEFTRLKNNTTSNDIKALRSIVLDSIEKSIYTLDPSEMVRNSVNWSLDSDTKAKILKIRGFNGQKSCELSYHFAQKTENQDPRKINPNVKKFDSIVIIGGGKASYFMAKSLLEIIGIYFPCQGLVNLPEGQNFGDEIVFQHGSLKSSITLNYARHPIPNEQGLIGTQKMMELVHTADEKTLIIVVISGGGSALMPYPRKGLSLESKQKVNSILIKCGAEIKEINTIRKHLSHFKGGNLTKQIFPHTAVSLIISDVIGDHMDVIASGPTVPDESTFQDCLKILTKYNILDSIPSEAKEIILKGVKGEIDENPKLGDEIFRSIDNLLIGSVENAKSEIVLEMSKQNILNFSRFASDHHIDISINNLGIMKGEASEFGRKMAEFFGTIQKEIIKTQKSITQKNTQGAPKMFYLLNSGEFTVTIRGKGTGGRNQEMLLALLLHLKENYSHITSDLDFCMISIAFDGIEGNSPAAGAIIDSDSIQRIITYEKSHDNPIRKSLENNDSYSIFKQFGDAIEIGQTGTNVNDLSLLVVKIKK